MRFAFTPTALEFSKVWKEYILSSDALCPQICAHDIHYRHYTKPSDMYVHIYVYILVGCVLTDVTCNKVLIH